MTDYERFITLYTQQEATAQRNGFRSYADMVFYCNWIYSDYGIMSLQFMEAADSPLKQIKLEVLYEIYFNC
ncbi:MAG: hypothetical protein J6X18_00575 [Bacteroidales bacterium]|nr:hypothetical protein [Bacteroidales bacterium]